MSRERLGKGLGALLGEYLEPAAPPSDTQRLPLSCISASALQPRRVFTEGELDELAASIRENGLLQPPVVRPAPGRPGQYELVVGERRFRAVTRLGWTDVPVIVRDATDETLLVLALVENLQREALNPVEEAEGYAALGEKFDLSHADIARAVGKDRSTVANLVRLLSLPPSIRKMLEDGLLSQGHARALLAVDDSVLAADLARQAVKDGWSVRELERRVGKHRARPARKDAAAKSPVMAALEGALEEHLQTRVEIKEGRGGKGSVTVSYHGPDDFERVFEMLTGRSVRDVIE